MRSFKTVITAVALASIISLPAVAARRDDANTAGGVVERFVKIVKRAFGPRQTSQSDTLRPPLP
jgi:hypothetical protein